LKGQLIAFDFGSHRIGVAVARDSMVFTRPAISAATAVPSCVELIQLEQPERVFVGLPLLLSGAQGSAADGAIEFAQRIASLASCAVFLVDERYTTTLADRTLRQLPLSGKKRRQIVDSAAAAELLRFILKAEESNPDQRWRPAVV